MRASYASTSLRWSLASALLLFAVTLGLWSWKIAEIASYETAAAAATIPANGTVVWAEDVSKGDDHIHVSYRDLEGVMQEVTFAVNDAGAYPVGSPFALRLSSDSPVAFPTEAEDVLTPTVYAIVWLLVLALVAVLPIAWGVRLWRWWRASRAPVERVIVRMYCAGVYGSRSILVSTAVLARVEDATGRHWYQRVMWEPWMAHVRSQPFRAEGRRGHPRGPMVLRTAAGRLLWPAGPARDTTPGSADWRKGRPRWPGTRLSLIVVAVLVGLFLGIFTGPAGAVGGACYLFCTHMFWGGGPVALASRR